MGNQVGWIDGFELTVVVVKCLTRAWHVRNGARLCENVRAKVKQGEMKRKSAVYI
jgi:hypothetical protein